MGTLGLGTKNQSKEVSAYPIPTNSIVNLTLPEGTEIVNYEVYSILGQKVKQGVLTANTNHSVDLSILTSGVYIISLKTAEGVVYKVKVIKN
ncbi:hypothetical protein D3C84_872600 [compost metagenome]